MLIEFENHQVNGGWQSTPEWATNLIGQGQEGASQYNQHLANALGQQALHSYGALQNAYKPPFIPPAKHTAKELTAFALAWIFGDEKLAPLLDYEPPSAACDLRAPTALDILRLSDEQPATWQVINARILALSADWRFRTAGAVIALFDLHAFHFMGCP